ncbi:hypothetical protein L0N19_19965, partial [[Eubacterium] rectale]|uniref:hypothetical protein n=1 Tax=Agathobacter rectalis TaxID=39491 RepID=UPI0027D321F8
KEPTNLSASSLGVEIQGTMKVKVKLLSRVRLCNHMDYSLPVSSIHGIFQARIQARVAMSFPRGPF